MTRPLKRDQAARARALRQFAPDAEIRLWAKLRNRQLAGAKFRRQQPVGPYIADFLCSDGKLILEADGGQHATRIAEDEARTRYLNGQGFRVLRFWNRDILLNTDDVLEAIHRALCHPPSPARRPDAAESPLPSRERGRKKHGRTSPSPLMEEGDPAKPSGVRGDPVTLEQAIQTLAAGNIVAIPTETVYGLAADAADGVAVAKIYAAKGRPGFNPLIVHVDGLAMAETLVAFTPLARDLARRFWPGPLTLVLPLKPGAPVAGLVTAGLTTLAVRAPAHPVAQAIIAGLGRPIAAPSANASGRISATTAAHVRASLGPDVPVLDGGPTAAGLESTILGFDGDRAVLLRPGAVAAEVLPLSLDGRGDSRPSGPRAGEGGLTEAAGVHPHPARASASRPLPSRERGKITAPGQLASHYAPAQPVRLNAVTATPGEFHIGFGPIPGDRNLSPAGDLAEAAADLFAALHVAEASGRNAIAVAPIPDHGLGTAINDRLRRAAAPR